MRSSVVVSVMVLAVAGCGKEKASTYEVPKESATSPHAMGASTSMMGSRSDNDLVMSAHASMAAQMPDAGFKSELPAGWTEKSGSGMRMASWTIGETSIDFYLISLSMGDVPSNVNRWRGQIGLPVASPEEIAQSAATFPVDGHEVTYAELYNTENGMGIIAAIVDLSPKFWYFTAKGSVDELKAHSKDIRSFLESIKFEGHGH